MKSTKCHRRAFSKVDHFTKDIVTLAYAIRRGALRRSGKRPSWNLFHNNVPTQDATRRDTRRHRHLAITEPSLLWADRHTKGYCADFSAVKRVADLIAHANACALARIAAVLRTLISRSARERELTRYAHASYLLSYQGWHTRCLALALPVLRQRTTQELMLTRSIWLIPMSLNEYRGLDAKLGLCFWQLHLQLHKLSSSKLGTRKAFYRGIY